MTPALPGRVIGLLIMGLWRAMATKRRAIPMIIAGWWRAVLQEACRLRYC